MDTTNDKWQDFNELLENPEFPTFTPPPVPVPLDTLVKRYPTLKPPVIDGVVREGETANIVAPPKVGKSWLMYSLLASIATGRRWLDTFDCTPGPVLLIDNELHPETVANRMPKVTDAMGITSGLDIDVVSLRGKDITLDLLAPTIENIEHGRYKAIVLDAWYRFIPDGKSENSNADVMKLYNMLDRYAAHTGAAIIAVHHTSKGLQSEKSVTDTGAGAGSQSRAADAHVILREHEEEGHVVLDAAVRSFKPIDRVALRWEFPLWRRTEDIDTDALKGRKTKGEERTARRDAEGIEMIHKVLMKNEALTPNEVIEETGMGKGRVKRLLGTMKNEGVLDNRDAKRRGQSAKEWFIPDEIRIKIEGSTHNP